MSLKIACIGGGSGLSALLSGIKYYADLETDTGKIIDLDSLAAIVTVSDDGGSSGRLVEEFDMLPPGDIRRLLYTLSDADELAGLFEYRFSSNGDLGGHTIGNLLLTALTEIQGNFPRAIQAASRLLSVRGQIIPVTLDYTVLCAELTDGDIVRGESTIPVRENREPIKRVFFEPRENGKIHHDDDELYECQAHETAMEALVNADVIIIGPGSLYTSIMPNLAIQGIVETIKLSNAVKIYVCNVMTQPGETDGYSVTDHVNAILDHAKIPIDYVLVNNQPAPQEIMQGYVRNELVSQLTRIKSLSEEGLSRLSEDTAHQHIVEVLNLAKDISTLSAETVQVADASKVQVSYNREQEKLEEDGIIVVEADLIRDMVVTEIGTWLGRAQMNVIRHDPEKLAINLVGIFKDHPQLSKRFN